MRRDIGDRRVVPVEHIDEETDGVTAYTCHFCFDSAEDFHPQWTANYLEPDPPDKKTEDAVWAAAFEKLGDIDMAEEEAAAEGKADWDDIYDTMRGDFE